LARSVFCVAVFPGSSQTCLSPDCRTRGCYSTTFVSKILLTSVT
jgi:hypothetical protein